MSRSVLVVALCVGTAACSSSSDDSATTTSAAVDASTSAPANQDAITVAVYWNRPHGTARPIDIPGYKDPDGGPYPYVLFGSVTNAGSEPIPDPQVAVDWYVEGPVPGASIHTTTAPARDPQGATLATLAPGASADLIVVVESEPIASQLPDAQPSFALYIP
jgi:hypothetical protein